MAKPYVPYDGPIVDRKFAIGNGLPRYFTGKPCKHGHISERKTKYKKCVECVRVAPDSGKKETDKARLARWVKANKNKVSEYQKRYRANNPKIQCEWVKNNPERAKQLYRAAYQNRRARINNTEGFHSANDIHKIGCNQKWKCAYCKCCVKEKYHVDHIYPISKGGKNWASNLQITCPSCNSKKHAKDPLDYAREIGRLL